MRGRLNTAGVLAALAAVAWVLAFTPTSLGAPVLAPSRATPIAATPPYKVKGHEVVGTNGAQFVPYGFVLDCPALTDVPVSDLCNGDSNQDPWNASDMLTAAASFWHADVIRFQVAQEYLFKSNGRVNTNYLGLIDSLVDQATSLNMASIVTLQEERFHAPPLPTATAVRFWSYMAKHFASNPNVLFDLFNEPRLSTSAVGGSERKLWQVWRNGGTVGGVQYVGDQALVNTIRKAGAKNVIIAEGNDSDRDLKLLPEHYLSGKNIAYGVEPNLSSNEDTEAEWNADFGRFTTAVPILPEAFRAQYQECNPNAPTVLPQLFSYLRTIHMGLIVWTLLPGVTTVGTNLYDPTTFAPSRRSTDPCLVGHRRHSAPTTTYGEGANVQRYFANHSPG
jgi:Cellulase (glycosyl hydrolase family 5)